MTWRSINLNKTVYNNSNGFITINPDVFTHQEVVRHGVFGDAFGHHLSQFLHHVLLVLQPILL